MPVERLAATPSYQELVRRLGKGRRRLLRYGGLWGSSKALAAAALSRDLEQPLLVLCADPGAAALALDDLGTFGAGVVPFPAREGRLGAEADVLRERFHALDLAARSGFAGVLVAPLLALLQPVPAGGGDVLELAQGLRLDPETLLKRLVQAGFERVPAISAPREVARRGDILDFYAPALGEPLRLEFFDDELESVRVFDIGSQRTRHVLKQVKVPLAHDLPEAAGENDRLPLQALPESVVVLRFEPAALADAADKLRFLGLAHARALERNAQLLGQRRVLDLATLPGEDGTLATLSVEEYCRGVAEGAALLAARAHSGEKVIVCCSSEAEADRLRQILEDTGHAQDALELRLGGLDRGFRVPEARLIVLHHRELVPGHGAHRPRARGRGAAYPAESVDTALALRPGDVVVHAVHGLARFRGIESAAAEDGRDQDVLLLEFAQGALLQVPVSRVDLVERYIGAGGAAPELDRLGSGAFERRRRRVQAAVEDMAAELLEVQARRLSTPARPLPDGGEEQRRFEAAFPFEDTPDQAQATRDLHHDLAQPRAMDRLLCGDVGYGKTELAARAAFRAIFAGAQVALLVPTTVLAEQHTRSLRERFAGWPVRVEPLSRIRPAVERRQVLKDLAAGRVDLVIGTHRLLSKDVRFADLGLVIIDEEQRFGVRAKELLKKKRASVHVLTLSATPIPRTLHMAFAGLRDISNLTTPPRGRLEIHTEIRYSEEDVLIREAVRAELARGGQVFFVHNRVRGLDKVAARLQRLVPEARIVLGHGQMEPRELEKAMLAFVRGLADLLCSTTIVESGLDIPRANTIFIDDAHNYGLADLHQLRGRVGRSHERGICYLLIPRGEPLNQDARRRLKAVEELRYLGAGFQVALRDLEIRGAGNLLGEEQSGHIAAVGYETYRKLLGQAVARLRKQAETAAARGETPSADVSLGVAAALPPSYVPDEEARLEILREFDRITAPEQVEAVLAALRDRFGPPPEGVAELARLFFLKHRLGALGLDAVHWVDDRLVCTVADARKMERGLRARGVDLRVLTPRRAHWVLPASVRTPEAVLSHLYRIAATCRPDSAARKVAQSPR
ncbi:MAG: transcription-repair coupling factor [Planctomycetota bacterium]|nr:MAG: transcription-repair coupling factor [Planctomycetota bacterium]